MRLPIGNSEGAGGTPRPCVTLRGSRHYHEPINLLNTIIAWSDLGDLEDGHLNRVRFLRENRCQAEGLSGSIVSKTDQSAFTCLEPQLLAVPKGHHTGDQALRNGNRLSSCCQKCWRAKVCSEQDGYDCETCALTLFRRAADLEEARAEWTRRLIQYLYRAQHNPGESHRLH